MFFGGLLHGALWIRNHLEFGIAILGQQKETSGIAALSLLGIIVLSSLRVVRRLAYEVFFIVQWVPLFIQYLGLYSLFHHSMLSYVAFFVTICYHTIYASPWIFPPLAFYGLDILLRMFRHRIKDAVIIPIGSQMTLVSHSPYKFHGVAAFSGLVFIFKQYPCVSPFSLLRSTSPMPPTAGLLVNMFAFGCSSLRVSLNHILLRSLVLHLTPHASLQCQLVFHSALALSETGRTL